MKAVNRLCLVGFVLVTQQLLNGAIAHECVHDELIEEVDKKHGPATVSHHVKYASTINVEEAIRYSDDEEPIAEGGMSGVSRRRLAEGSFENIRIVLDFHRLRDSSESQFACRPGDADQGKSVRLKEGNSVSCSREDELSGEKEVFLRNIVQDAASWWSTALSVERVVGNLRLAPSTWSDCDFVCCDGQLPSSDVSPGRPNSDTVLYITARPTSDNVIAWAVSCQRDSFGRPIAGHINFAPALLKLDNRDRNRQFSTALHEMAHVLGFSSSHYNHFRNPATGSRWDTVTAEFGERGTVVTKITTPTVVSKAKELFNCNWANAGLELENYGGSGSQGSHWEKRLVNNEFMSATIAMNPVRSAFTLALFEDMGWYAVNYAVAEVLQWGYEKGCNFVKEKCDTWDSAYFCQGETLTGCTVDRTAKAYCALRTYASAIPSAYRYFGDSTTGGRDRYLDFCPIYDGYSNGDCRDQGFRETYLSSIEVAGDSSRCFVSNGTPHCFETTCTADQLLQVRVGADWRTCPRNGGSVSFPGGRTVNCPRASEVCGLEYFCNNGKGCSGAGTCNSDGNCVCYSGRTGPGCSELVCPSSQSGGECSTGSVCPTNVSGVPQASCCNRLTGTCVCQEGYTGLACEELLCPGGSNAKVCSGHGSCSDGVCECDNSYSGIACSDVPGCKLDECNQASAQGQCDTTTGACACNPGFFGAQCETNTVPDIVQLPVQVGNVTTFNASVGTKEMAYFAATLNGTTYDIGVRVISYEGDSDVYAMYVDPLANDQGQSILLPQTRTATWSSTNSAKVNREDIVFLCGSYSVPRGEGVTRCTKPDPNFIVHDYGTLYIGVLGFEFNKTSRFGISVEQDGCVKVRCGDHGVCDRGECRCDELWIGTVCDIPNCPGTPDCSNHGDCVIPDGEVDPRCKCSFGFAGDDCGSLAPGFENPPQALPIGGTSLLEGANANGSILVATGSGNWSYFQVNIPSNQSTHSMFVSLQEREIDECPDPTFSGVFSADGCGKGDPVLVARRNVLPSLLEFTTFDADSWTLAQDDHHLLLDSSNGFVPGIWYVGVLNTAYARSRLYYDLNIDTRGRCPPSLTCSGHGVCNPMGSSLDPVCECTSDAVNGLTYTGPLCQYSYTTVDSNAILDGTVLFERYLSVSEWQYFAITIVPENLVALPDGTTRELSITMNTIGGENDPDKIQKFTNQPLLVLAQGNDIPTLASVGQLDFDGWRGRLRTQTVSLKQPALKPRRYFVGIHNRHYASQPVGVTVGISLSVPFNQTAVSKCIPPHDPRIEACHSRGTCVSDASVATPYCFCRGTWSGELCNNPSLSAISGIQEAAQNIDNLCNTCTRRVSLSRDEYRIFRIPQALRTNQGIRITVKGTNGTDILAAGDVDIYVSEQLPRSAYDFVYIASGDGPEETLILSEVSTSGRYFMAVYAKAEATYQISVERITLSDPSDTIIDINVVDALGKWLVESPAGQATLAIIVVVSTVILASGLFVVFRQTGIVDKTMRGFGSMFGMPVAEAVD